jgi:hypothetical protein
MSDFFERLGFPAPEQRDSIRFHFAKGLTYGARRNLILGCLFAGLILQIIMVHIFPGILFLLIAVLLGMVQGFDSRIRLKNYKNDETWTEVPIEKIREIEKVRQKSLSWDRDSLDITNSYGCMIFILTLVLGIIFCIVAGLFAQDINVTIILAIDFLILTIPFYFTGVRWALKQGNLPIKVKLLLSLHSYFEKVRIESETFIPMLLLAREKENKTIPVDVKFQIRYKGLPPDHFYGLQSTVNLNLVQGTSYAYFYCVLVAKPDFGLKRYKDMVKESKRVMCEYQQQTDAEVIVIRHPTSKTSGYFTDDDACKEILSAAMNAARVIEHEQNAAEKV